jgi:hypothetical protein
MNSDFKLVITVGMNYDEETDEVICNGVEFTALDENDEVIDMEDTELAEMANQMFNELKNIKVEAE